MTAMLRSSMMILDPQHFLILQAPKKIQLELPQNINTYGSKALAVAREDIKCPVDNL